MPVINALRTAGPPSAVRDGTTKIPSADYDTSSRDCNVLLVASRPDSGHALAPVIEDVPQRLLEGNLRPPPHRRLRLGGVAAQHRDVRRPQARRLFTDGDAPRSRFSEEEVEDLVDHPRAPGAEVVDLAGLALLEQEPVAADDVAHVG